ncbi:hypothetical protein F991_00042 [Acinetobacter sp. CIP-A165]|uniref:oligosaccharide repeat unit polymerase n=1 Tax=Acinetobacter sp. CIP-A165 TaxID=40373 RepID=UPI0002CE32FB|nr:oligosaccharide repeat unit polymerase [Acinetobacter sp. CIP-A165]ENU32060.1 hypothetical protein F991_00042 [Acinetobacter sp. CIP-A165]
MANSKIIYFFLVFVYNLVLVYLYQDYIYPKYSYFGMQFNESYSFHYSIVLSFLSSLFVFLLPKYIEKPSDILLVFSYFFVFLPAINVGYIALNKADIYFFEYSLYLIINILVLIFFNRINTRKMYFYSLTKRTTNSIVFLVSALLYILVFLYYRPDINNILKLEDVTGVYDLRSDYREQNSGYPSIVVYAFTWLVRFFTPLILLYGLINNNRLIVLLSFVLTLLLFSVSGHKSIMLGYGLVVISFFLFNKVNKVSFFILFNLYFICLLFSTVLYKFIDLDILINAFVRRAMHVPGILSIFFYEFFSNNDNTYLGYSILKSLVIYPYDVTPPFIIGDYYFGRADMSANVNYIISGYADFGFFGGILFTTLVVLFYKVLDSIYLFKVGDRRFLALIILPTWALVNSAFITVLVTHGLFLIFLYFLICNKHERK